MNGTIVKITERRFGFIRSDADQKEYFFHADDCLAPYDNLREHDRVEFLEDKTVKGLRARNIKYLV